MKNLVIVLLFALLSVGCTSIDQRSLRTEVANIMSEYDQTEAADEARVSALVCGRINAASVWYKAPIFCSNLSLRKTGEGTYKGTIVMLRSGKYYATPITVVDDGVRVSNTPFFSDETKEITPSKAKAYERPEPQPEPKSNTNIVPVPLKGA